MAQNCGVTSNGFVGRPEGFHLGTASNQHPHVKALNKISFPIDRSGTSARIMASNDAPVRKRGMHHRYCHRCVRRGIIARQKPGRLDESDDPS